MVERDNRAHILGLNPDHVAGIVGYADAIPAEPRDLYADGNRRIAFLVLPRAVVASAVSTHHSLRS
ncbi:MAG: hypothetical protein DMG05_04585 [Acidobacteria bacterium]|nr:MAG: hypothetical protein DMG05_04585 [Acidobacteriota bacterium]